MFVLIVSQAEFSPSEHVIRQRCANETTCPTHHNARATAERGGSGWWFRWSATAAVSDGHCEITEPTRSILRNARNVTMTLIVPSAEPLTIAADVGFPDEPFAYISCVMQKIAEGWPNSRIDELMPWAWRPVAQRKAA
ncbi:MAG: transposase domain-containing protein [Methylocella sp.]